MAPDEACSCANEWLLQVLSDAHLAGSVFTGWHRLRSAHFSLGMSQEAIFACLSVRFGLEFDLSVPNTRAVQVTQVERHLQLCLVVNIWCVGMSTKMFACIRNDQSSYVQLQAS